jgi:hypothetical protein
MPLGFRLLAADWEYFLTWVQDKNKIIG